MDPRFGKVGKQTIKDTGPITRKRMETVEEELLARSLDFMERSVKAGKPFFLWHNTTRMHVLTRLSPKWENKSGYGLYADGMMELDDVVGALLKKLDDLGIADNTIVVFTTDNGAEIMTWPDGGNTPFTGEKGTTWEGGMRVPGLARWPGVIKPGTVLNEVMSARRLDAHVPRGRGRSGREGEAPQGIRRPATRPSRTISTATTSCRSSRARRRKAPRREIFYFDDNANLNAIRVDDWKISFKIMEGNIATGQLQCRPTCPGRSTCGRTRSSGSPASRGCISAGPPTSSGCSCPPRRSSGSSSQSFKEFPPSQKSGSFSVDQVLEQLQTSVPGPATEGALDATMTRHLGPHPS